MSAVLAGLVGLIAREIIQYLGGLISNYIKKIKKNAEDAASDKAIDQHAADVTKEMGDVHDPAKMDKADSDLLSGN